MNVLIAGIDGYLGWALAIHLKTRRHQVAGLDNFSRRMNVGQHIGWAFGCGTDVQQSIKSAGRTE